MNRKDKNDRKTGRCTRKTVTQIPTQKNNNIHYNLDITLVGDH